MYVAHRLASARQKSGHGWDLNGRGSAGRRMGRFVDFIPLVSNYASFWRTARCASGFSLRTYLDGIITQIMVEQIQRVEYSIRALSCKRGTTPPQFEEICHMLCMSSAQRFDLHRCHLINNVTFGIYSPQQPTLQNMGQEHVAD